MARAAFDMRILAFDPYLDPTRAAELGIELVADLPALLLAPSRRGQRPHAPHAGNGRLDRRARNWQRCSPPPTSSTPRAAGVIDEPALAAALRAGQLAGAGLDVLEQEPPPPGHPLLTLENVILTPHSATQTEEALRRTSEHVSAGGARRPPRPATPMVRQPRGLGKLITPHCRPVIPAKAGIYTPSLSLRDGEGAGGEDHPDHPGIPYTPVYYGCGPPR